MSAPHDYLTAVRNQYESYPYPPRDPEMERHRLLRVEMAELPVLNHYCHGGRQGFSDFRALVAGAGTGDATLFLASQLAPLGGKVVSLDMSEASTQVAKARAAVRGLHNITWVHASLLDLPELDIGPFDTINCSGVLHHLKNPDAGLAALKSVLAPGGSMGLMLYARYGREGVYQMQDMMRLLNRNETDMEACVTRTRQALGNLPESHWYRHSENWFNDISEFGDPGLYDLLLHPQDRAYSIPEVYDWLKAAGLYLVDFGSRHTRLKLRPESAISDPTLLRHIRQLPVPRQQTIMEIIHGNIAKQSFYVAAEPAPGAQLDHLDNVPFIYDFAPEVTPQQIAATLKQARGKPVTITNPSYRYSVPPGRYGALIMAQIDGQRSLAEVFDAVRASTGKRSLDNATLLADFRPTFAAMAQVDHLLLRHRDTPILPLLSSIDGGIHQLNPHR